MWEKRNSLSFDDKIIHNDLGDIFYTDGADLDRECYLWINKETNKYDAIIYRNEYDDKGWAYMFWDRKSFDGAYEEDLDWLLENIPKMIKY